MEVERWIDKSGVRRGGYLMMPAEDSLVMIMYIESWHGGKSGRRTSCSVVCRMNGSTDLWGPFH